MKPLFIALLHELRISEDLGDGDKIRDDLRIINSPAKIEALISPTHRSLMGEMEYHSLLNGDPVVISQSDIPQDMTAEQYLLKRLYEVQAFVMTSWIHRDNAINCELGFILYADDRLNKASSNFIAHLYSTSSGEKPKTTLTREELREIRATYRRAVGTPSHPFLMPTSQLTATYPRLSRAIYLVGAARGESDVAMKIAHYCSAFETLFSTSQAELAHQLSERLSCYLNTGLEDRLAAYKSLKAAYGIRSKVVHGATIKDQKMDEILAASKYCDEVARAFFRKVLDQPERQELFDRPAQAFDEAMLRIVFSGAAA